jgi:outer membrane protein
MKLFFIPCLVLSLRAGLVQADDVMHLTLAEARRLAVENNPQLGAARFTASAAHQVAPQFKANLLPQVTGLVTGVGADSGSRLAAGGLNNPAVYSRFASGVAASQLLSDFGRTRSLMAASDLHAQAQDQNTETTRADILLATSRAYFSVMRAQSVLTVAQETVKARQLIVDQVTTLADNKLRSTLDVSFANVNLADSRLLLSQAVNELASAKAELAAVMGLPRQTDFALAEEPMPPAPPASSDPLIQDAIANRPELKSLRLEQNSAERFAKAEHTLNYPTVAAFGAAGVVPAGESQVPGSYGAAGINVAIPIFNGGLFKARQTEADLKAQAAAKQVDDLTNRVMRDVRVAYLNAQTAYERVGLTDQILKQAQLSLELAQERYRLGLSSFIELSQSQLNLTSAQIASAAARFDYEAQNAAVEFQIGALR